MQNRFTFWYYCLNIVNVGASKTLWKYYVFCFFYFLFILLHCTCVSDGSTVKTQWVAILINRRILLFRQGRNERDLKIICFINFGRLNSVSLFPLFPFSQSIFNLMNSVFHLKWKLLVADRVIISNLNTLHYWLVCDVRAVAEYSLLCVCVLNMKHVGKPELGSEMKF